jgi:hypothetical protein
MNRSWKQTLRGQRIFNSIHHPSSKIQNRLQSTIPNRNADAPIGINSAPATRHSAYGAICLLT